MGKAFHPRLLWQSLYGDTDGENPATRSPAESLASAERGKKGSSRHDSAYINGALRIVWLQ